MLTQSFRCSSGATNRSRDVFAKAADVSNAALMRVCLPRSYGKPSGWTNTEGDLADRLSRGSRVSRCGLSWRRPTVFLLSLPRTGCVLARNWSRPAGLWADLYNTTKLPSAGCCVKYWCPLSIQSLLLKYLKEDLPPWRTIVFRSCHYNRSCIFSTMSSYHHSYLSEMSLAGNMMRPFSRSSRTRWKISGASMITSMESR